jgi:hypothetical protein
MTEEQIMSQRIAQFAVKEAKKGNPILLDVSNMEITNLSYIRKIINSYLYDGKLFDEVSKEYIKVDFGGKFHPQIPHKLIKVYTCLKYEDGTYRTCNK